EAGAMGAAAGIGPAQALLTGGLIDGLAAAIRQRMEREVSGLPGEGTMGARALDAEIHEIGIDPERKAADLGAVPVQGHAGNGLVTLEGRKLLLKGTCQEPPMQHGGR